MRWQKVGEKINFKNGWYPVRSYYRVVEIQHGADRITKETIIKVAVSQVDNAPDSHIIYGWEEEGDPEHRLYWNVFAGMISDIRPNMEMIQVE